jgi:iron complex transport system ATP-binding protein
MMDNDQSLLHTEQLVIGYRGNKMVSGPLTLDLYPGELICLLGPNGCGKSTLLRTVSGLQPSLSGLIELEGHDLLKLKPAQVAKKLSLVLTDNVRSGNLDVYSLVALGRYPHSGWLGILDQNDQIIIEKAMESTHTSAFRNRKIDSLSDGECQKVMLARAIAQDTPVIMLDEPTAHLDLPSRIQLMRLLHQLARETNKAILLSTHELDLALQVADRIWLMSTGGELAAGSPEELVLNGSFQKAFDKDGIAFDPATGNFMIHDVGRELIIVEGEGIAAFWTRKALIRKGYELTAAPNIEHGATLKVRIAGDGDTAQWILRNNNLSITHTSLSDFLDSL